ncbi:MAG: hypothetical protein K0Q59_2250 [Paenibacillus sp.]|nr:hypothetical protein [Paenibacillus sp.]
MFKKSLLLIVCSLLVGQLMLIFAWHELNMYRYIYSVGTLLIGFYYFKRVPSKGMRVAFVLLAIVFWVLLMAVYVAIGKIPILNLEPPGLKE